MGQVFGSTQNTNNSNNIIEEYEWISVGEQKKRFHVHKAADAYLGLGKEYVKHELFDAQIAGMIAEYTVVNDRWSIACNLLGQDKVPAFPEKHMSEIGDPDFVFYLIPEGSLNQFERRLSRFAQEILGIQNNKHPLKFRYFCSIDRHQHGDIPHEVKWASMKKKLLKESRGMNYKDHKNLAAKERISIPSLQTVAKILFLDKLVQIATLSSEEALFPVGNYTHVNEKSFGTSLCIGGCDPAGIDIDGDEYTSYYDYIGLAVVQEF